MSPLLPAAKIWSQRIEGTSRSVGERAALTRKVIAAVGWTVASKGVVQVVGIFKLFILAKLLTPSDFGVVSAAMVIFGIVDILTEPGFEVALIQRQENVTDYIGTAWFASIVRGLCLGIFLFIAAPAIATFFGDGRIVPVMRVLAVLPVLTSLANPTTVFWVKEFRFGYTFGLGTTSQLVGAAAGITIAIMFRNWLALVVVALAAELVRVIGSHLLAAPPPRPWPDFRKARELARFGRWVLLSRIFSYVLAQGDKAVVGRLFGTTSLGLYGMASRLGNLSSTEVSHALQRVLLPTYASVQNDRERLKAIYRNVFYSTACLTLPLSVGSVLFAQGMTVHFLGDRWLPMVPILQILAVAGFFRSLAATAGPLYQGTGTPHAATFFQGAQLVLAGGLIFPAAAHFGAEGVAIAMGVGAVAAHTWAVINVLRVTGVDMRAAAAGLVGPAVASGGGVAGAILLAPKLGGTPVGFVVLVLCCGLIYLCILAWVDRDRLGQLTRRARAAFGTMGQATEDGSSENT